MTGRKRHGMVGKAQTGSAFCHSNTGGLICVGTLGPTEHSSFGVWLWKHDLEGTLIMISVVR